jgi:hypothetical protein
MVDTMAHDIELNSPTVTRPVAGRERVRAVFHILTELFEDFEYARFTVLIRPMSGLRKLADSIAERMRASRPPST